MAPSMTNTAPPLMVTCLEAAPVLWLKVGELDAELSAALLLELALASDDAVELALAATGVEVL